MRAFFRTGTREQEEGDDGDGGAYGYGHDANLAKPTRPPHGGGADDVYYGWAVRGEAAGTGPYARSGGASVRGYRDRRRGCRARTGRPRRGWACRSGSRWPKRFPNRRRRRSRWPDRR